MLIIPVLTKYSTAFIKSVSDIASVAHHPAVFFTQVGIFCDGAEFEKVLT